MKDRVFQRYPTVKADEVFQARRGGFFPFVEGRDRRDIQIDLKVGDLVKCTKKIIVKAHNLSEVGLVVTVGKDRSMIKFASGVPRTIRHEWLEVVSESR